MHLPLKAALLAGAAALSASVVHAHGDDIPEFMQNIEGIEFQGQISGMDAYTASGYQGLWLVSPDGRTAIAGTVFSARGRDVGAALADTDPIRVFEIGGESEASAGMASPVTPVIPDDAATAPLQMPGSVDSSALPGGGEGLSPAEIDSMEAGVDRIESNVFGETDLAEVAEPVAPAADTDVDTDVNTGDVTSNAKNALQGLSEEDREILMRALVELLRDVDNEVQFQAAVKVWTEETVRRYREALEEGGPEAAAAAIGRDEGQDQASGEAAASDSSAEDGPVASQDQPAKSSATAADPGSEAKADVADDAPVVDRLLADVRNDGLWFGIGVTGAPVAYAFIDPTCPYCAKAIKALAPAIEAGELQLRVALAPVVSDRAPGYIAGIFAAEEPPIAFIEHEFGWADGARSPIEPRNWENLNAQLRSGVMRNAGLMHAYEIPGVPFFVFDTDDGARAVNGVPDSAEVFENALPDPYTGDS